MISKKFTIWFCLSFGYFLIGASLYFDRLTLKNPNIDLFTWGLAVILWAAGTIANFKNRPVNKA